MDADSPESKRILFIGTDNFRAGQESGTRMVGDLLKGKGNVVVVTIPGQPNVHDRLRGVEEALKRFPGMKIVQSIDDRADPRNAYDAISALMQCKDRPDGIICLEASGGAGSADALHRLDLTGKIPIVAFDNDPETLDWIQRGAIAATVVQKPYVMSYYGLKFLDDLHHNAVHEFRDSKEASDTWTLSTILARHSYRMRPLLHQPSVIDDPGFDRPLLLHGRQRVPTHRFQNVLITPGRNGRPRDATIDGFGARCRDTNVPPSVLHSCVLRAKASRCNRTLGEPRDPGAPRLAPGDPDRPRSVFAGRLALPSWRS